MDTPIDRFITAERCLEALRSNDSKWASAQKRLHQLSAIQACEKKKAYRKVAEISGDWTGRLETLKTLNLHEELNQPQSERAVQFNELNQAERADNIKFGSPGWGYDILEPDTFFINIAQLFELEKMVCKINRQRVGHCVLLHVDECLSLIKTLVDNGQGQMLIDPVTLLPAEYDFIRLLVMLDDWSPGQFFIFGDDVLTHWKQGDTFSFDWLKAPHASSNSSHHIRHTLKVTGMIRKNSNHWLESQQKPITLTL